LQGGGELRSDRRVIFAEQSTPLRMPHDHVRATELPEHRCRYLSRKSALGVLTYGLATPCDTAARQRLLGLEEVRKRHTHRHQRCVQIGDPITDRTEQRRVVGKAAMHLPIPRDQLGAHACNPAKKLAKFTLPPETGQLSGAAQHRSR